MGRIALVEAWPVNVPLEATYLMASGVVPGISRTVVRVTTEDCEVGLGESTSPADATTLGGQLGQSFVGRDVADALAQLDRFAPPAAVHRSDARVVIDAPLSG